MRVRSLGFLTFEKGEKILGRRDQKLLCNNTYIVRLGDDCLGVQLYGKTIIRILRSGYYILDSCGYRTVVTKSRINSLTPAKVYSQGGHWHIGYTSWRDNIWIDSIGVPLAQEEVKRLMLCADYGLSLDTPAGILEDYIEEQER